MLGSGWLTVALALLISVKVVSIQHGTGRVRFLLPMHHVEIVAVHEDEQESIGIEEREFYKAGFDGQGRLVVKLKKRRVRFLPEKVYFLEGK